MRKFKRPITKTFWSGRVKELCIGMEGCEVVCASGRKYPLDTHSKKVLLEQIEFVDEYKKLNHNSTDTNEKIFNSTTEAYEYYFKNHKK